MWFSGSAPSWSHWRTIPKFHVGSPDFPRMVKHRDPTLIHFSESSTRAPSEEGWGLRDSGKGLRVKAGQVPEFPGLASGLPRACLGLASGISGAGMVLAFSFW